MNHTSRLDVDLLDLYDRPGPRYTSYPTAPHFDSRFGEHELWDHVRRSNNAADPRPISLYIHIPYCFSPCFYCGCNRLITRDPGKADSYVARLLREMEMLAPSLSRARSVTQLHLGGGTPNFLKPAQLARLIEGLAERFTLSTDAARDFSIELDPRTVDHEYIAVIAALGFNRVSLGVQDFDPGVQDAVNRHQSIEQTLSVIDSCRRSAMRSINVDLIYGLPRQTIDGFSRTLQTIVATRPDRVAIYGYAHMPELFKAQRRIRADELPDSKARIRLLHRAIERLGSAGYRYIGMDHFSLPEDDLAQAQRAGRLQRNFMGYTTHARTDLFGFGVSAISHVGESFSQNFRQLRSWESAVDEGRLAVWRGLELGPDDVLRADVIQQLMCHGQIDVPAVERRYDIAFTEYFAEALLRLRPLVAARLALVQNDRILVTAEGRTLLRVIAMCFDRYLSQPLWDPPHRAH